MNFSKHTQGQLKQAQEFSARRIQQLNKSLAAERATMGAIEAQQKFNQPKTMTHSEIEIALGHKVKIT